MTLTLPSTGKLACVLATLLTLSAATAFAGDTAAVVALLRDGKLTQAMASANQELAKNPRDLRMRFLKGVIQQQSGQTAAAISTYQRLVSEQPQLVEAHNNLASIYLAQGQVQKARETLDAAKRASRSHAVTYEKLGDIYEELARRTYTQVLQLEDGNTTLAPELRPILQLIDLPTQTGASTSDPVARPVHPKGQ